MTKSKTQGGGGRQVVPFAKPVASKRSYLDAAREQGRYVAHEEELAERAASIEAARAEGYRAGMELVRGRLAAIVRAFGGRSAKIPSATLTLLLTETDVPVETAAKIAQAVASDFKASVR